MPKAKRSRAGRTRSLKELIVRQFDLRPGVDYVDVDQPDLRLAVSAAGLSCQMEGALRDFADWFARICPDSTRQVEELRADRHFGFLFEGDEVPFMFHSLWCRSEPLPPVPWRPITDAHWFFYPNEFI
jgi:hypothetical protein